jgi:dienelactone hydrolase
MRRLLPLLLLIAGCAQEEDHHGLTMAISGSFDRDLPPADPRLGPPRKVTEGAAFRTPVDLAAWEKRVHDLRVKQLVACGLWPMPDRCPLNPVVTKTIDRGDYTIENLYFTSVPGFYVTGSLYRPKGPGPFPAVLEPHGHSKNGRLEDRGEKSSDRYPYQARCIGLAKLGCIAFFHDMVGYADSKQVRHPTDSPKTRVPEGTDDFEGLEFEQHLLSTMGLQTWDSIRALDYLVSRPDVDPKRIGCTGGSGGATQTLMLMMTDERLAVAAPVCMVSTGFQGDCTCEQAALGKTGTDTVEFAAAFAPKPLIVVCATGDWTKEMIEKGGPEIRATYELMGAKDAVDIVRFPAPHNYNQASREAVIGWFNRWFRLGHPEPVKEPPIDPVDPRELVVFDARHPRPADALDAKGLKEQLIRSMRPPTAAELRMALRHMVASDLPARSDLDVRSISKALGITELILDRASEETQTRVFLFERSGNPGTAVILVVPKGVDSVDVHQGLNDRGASVLFIAARDPEPARARSAFFPCFNRMPIASRVHDILTAVAYLKGRKNIRSVDLVGLGNAGPACLLARALCGDAVRRTLVENSGFSFSSVKSVDDPMYLPGALRYGDLGAFAALAAPGELFLANSKGLDTTHLRAAYGKAEALHIEEGAVTSKAIVEWLTRP